MKLSLIGTTRALDTADGSVVVELFGEHDLSTAADVKAQIDRGYQRAGRPVVVDLRRTTFVDSSLIAVLTAASAGQTVVREVVVAPRGPVRQTLDLLDLAGTLAVSESVSGELRHARRAPRRPKLRRATMISVPA